METVVAENPLSFATSRIVTIGALLVRGVQRMLCLLKKFVLQPQAFFISLHGANRFLRGRCPSVHIILAQSARRGSAVSRIMKREARVPPDGRVKVVRH